MLNLNHPHDERLSMLASDDPEATSDSQLSEHVAACARCTDAVAELSVLRASLADLPDLRPHRPLRLLPEVAAEPSRVDRLAGWARRAFAPVLAAGAAVAMVGVVGTASPATLDSIVPGGDSGAGTAIEESTRVSEDDGEPQVFSQASDGAENYGASGGGAPAAASAAPEDVSANAGGEGPADSGERELATGAPAESSPWPMVLFGGVALMVAAGLMRWMLVPRADSRLR